MTVGQKLRKARRKAKKRQTDIAAETGCSQVAVQGWESDKWLPELSRIPDVAKAYGVEPTLFIGKPTPKRRKAAS